MLLDVVVVGDQLVSFQLPEEAAGVGESPLGRIVVVGTRRLEKSFLAGAPKLWGLPVETIDDSGRTPGEGAVRYSTLQRFKGLEADVVLLVDVDGSPHACTPVHLHVAASRARNRLYVFARQGVELPG